MTRGADGDSVVQEGPEDATYVFKKIHVARCVVSHRCAIFKSNFQGVFLCGSSTATGIRHTKIYDRLEKQAMNAPRRAKPRARKPKQSQNNRLEFLAG